MYKGLLSLKSIILISAFIWPPAAVFSQRNELASINDAVASTQKYIGKAEEYVNKIDAAFAKVEAEKERYKALIDGAEKQASLPRAILPGNADKNYALVLNEITIKPTGTVVELYMKIPGGTDHNGNKQHLYFIAEVPFSSKTGIAGDARLYLLKNCELNIDKHTYMAFNGLESGKFDSTYVTMNCKGFKDITLNGKLVFSKEFIQKEADPIKKTLSPEPLELKFNVHANKLANFRINFANIPTFQFKKLPDFSCNIESLYFDMDESSNMNPQDPFLTQYLASGNYASDPKVWKGLYIAKMDIEIPPVFKEDGSSGEANRPISVTAEHVIIDEQGLNINLQATKVLNYGNVKGFAMSIDKLSIQKESIYDEFKASMEGSILVPMSKDWTASKIGYTAHMFESGGELDLKVSADLTKIDATTGKAQNLVSFSALGAKADLTRFGLTFYYAKKDLEVS